MKLEVGKFYKAANGTKVGPMYKRGCGQWSGSGLKAASAFTSGFSEFNQIYNDDGSVYNMRDGEEQHLLISEWSDEVTFKVGDKVRRIKGSSLDRPAGMHVGGYEGVIAAFGNDECGETIIFEDGTEGFSDQYQLVKSAPVATTSPVTTETITRNSVVPGVYGRLEVKAVNQEQGFVTVCLNNQSLKGGDGQYLNADELDALADNARLIANAMRNPEVVG